MVRLCCEMPAIPLPLRRSHLLLPNRHLPFWRKNGLFSEEKQISSERKPILRSKWSPLAFFFFFFLWNLVVLALDIYVVVFDPVAFLNCLNLKNEKKKSRCCVTSLMLVPCSFLFRYSPFVLCHCIFSQLTMLCISSCPCLSCSPVIVKTL